MGSTHVLRFAHNCLSWPVFMQGYRYKAELSFHTPSHISRCNLLIITSNLTSIFLHGALRSTLACLSSGQLMITRTCVSLLVFCRFIMLAHVICSQTAILVQCSHHLISSRFECVLLPYLRISISVERRYAQCGTLIVMVIVGSARYARDLLFLFLASHILQLPLIHVVEYAFGQHAAPHHSHAQPVSAFMHLSHNTHKHHPVERCIHVERYRYP